jgi:uncharacterized protein YdhG (YjbR/CyaY superfamily)
VSIPTTPEDYLTALPDEAQQALMVLRETIRATAPEATELLSTGVPAFRYRNRILVQYGAARHHLALYIMRSDVLPALYQELEGFKVSKTAVRFTPGIPLPPGLIRRIICARMAEIDTKAQSRTSRSAASSISKQR